VPTIQSSATEPAQRTVLVTGVAGYIGSHTALAFLDAGWHVVGVDNLSVGHRSAVPDGIDFIEADCQSPDLPSLLAEVPIDAAVHFAGRIRVDESFDHPYEYYDANLFTAGQFFKTASQLGIGAVVFSSTAAVYGDAGSEVISESAPKEPKSPYGHSKLAAEWLLRDYCTAANMRQVILRYFNVAGADRQLRAGPRKDATHLIKAVTEAAVGLREGLIVNGDDYDTPDGTCIRDYIHVSDLAQAHLAAVQYLLDGGESTTLNCGYGHGYSVQEVINHAQELSERPIKVQIGPRRSGDPVSIVADTSEIRSLLSWTPQYDDLNVILKTSLDYEQAVLDRFGSHLPSNAQPETCLK